MELLKIRNIYSLTLELHWHRKVGLDWVLNKLMLVLKGTVLLSYKLLTVTCLKKYINVSRKQLTTGLVDQVKKNPIG